MATMTADQAQALRRIATAIVETVQEMGTMGAPGGHIYAALQHSGCTLNQYEQIMAGLVQAGYLERRGDCYVAGKRPL